jgi:preprotein translocase subunit SecG
MNPLDKPAEFPHIPRPMLSLIIHLLLAINVVVSLLIIFVVLMQRPKSEGLGAAFGGGMTENLFGAQTSNVLANFTRWLGGLFFFLTLILSILYAKQSTQRSAIQAAAIKAAAAATPEPSASPAPSAAAFSGTASTAVSGSAAATSGSAPALEEASPAPAASPSSAASPAASATSGTGTAAH